MTNIIGLWDLKVNNNIFINKHVIIIYYSYKLH